MKSELTRSILIDQLVDNASLSIDSQPKSQKSNKKLAGIIILSVFGTILIGAFLMVASKPKPNHIPINGLRKANTPDESTDLEEIIMALDSDSKEEVEYYSDMISLTQNNFLEYSKVLTYVDRNVPTEVKYEEVNEQISYGGDNTALDDIYDDILAENNKLIASDSTYDEIGSDGKLYLSGEYIERDLYKHVFSLGLYGGNVSDSEKAIKKVMKINPVSTTNYITGLYAPPGEVITVEISEEDLANIGGSLTFLIGHYTHNNIYSVNSANVGIKRVPNLTNSLAITKTTGYIGSFIGGPIYISNPSKTKQFTVTITGAVPYKHIIFGTTTKEEFEAMSDYTAPFFEFDIRDSIRYSGALSSVQNYDYDNLINNLMFWDKCV